MIPGRLLHRIAALICSAKSCEQVVEPAIADLQREQGTAALLGSYLAVLKVLGMCALDISDATDDDRRAVKRTLIWAFALTCATTMLLVLPPLSSFPEVRGSVAAMALLPQALPLAIPIGLAFAVAVGLSGRATMNVAKAMMLAMAAASLLSFATQVWGMPAGNQAFRTLVAEIARSNGELVPSNPQKGPNEMTLSELSRDISGFAASGRHQMARRYSWTFHLRFTLPVAVLAVATFLLALPVNRRAIRGLVAFVTCFSYWALMYIGEFAIRRDYMTPFAGAWLPNMVLAAATIVALSCSTRRDSSALASHS